MSKWPLPFFKHNNISPHPTPFFLMNGWKIDFMRAHLFWNQHHLSPTTQSKQRPHPLNEMASTYLCVVIENNFHFYQSIRGWLYIYFEEICLLGVCVCVCSSLRVRGGAQRFRSSSHTSSHLGRRCCKGRLLLITMERFVLDTVEIVHTEK